MKKIVDNFNKISQSTALPLIFLASFILVENLILLLPIEEGDTLYNYFSSGFSLLFCVIISGFIGYAYTKNTKKTIIISFSVSLSSMIIFALCGEYLSIIFAILISYFFSIIYKNIEIIYGFYILLAISVVFGVLIGTVYPYLYDLLKLFCNAVQNKRSLFGVINNAYTLLFTDNFEKFFYYKNYGTVVFVDKNILSGVKDIFAHTINNPGEIISKLMSGKYFVNIFVSLGVFFSLFKKLDSERNAAVAVLCFTALLTGEIKLLSIYLLLFNPILYIGYLGLIWISYFMSALLDIRIGFLRQGSIPELIKYGNNWLYFIITGIVIAVLTYFVFTIIMSKFNLSDKRFLPGNVKKLVNSLGGEKNIEKISNGKLYVYNPNLIDVLKVDCDIHENEVLLLQDDLDLLTDYF